MFDQEPDIQIPAGAQPVNKLDDSGPGGVSEGGSHVNFNQE